MKNLFKTQNQSKKLFFIALMLLLFSFKSFSQTAVYINSSGDCEFYNDATIDGTLYCNDAVLSGGCLIATLDYGPRLFPYSNNSGSIGTSSHAFSNVYTYYVNELSDKRQKENIKDLNNALDIVKHLKGVKYDIKKEYAFDESKVKDEKIIDKLEKERKNNLGFLAQDVNEVLPEVVSYDDSTDVYSINYTRIIPVLVEAIKELSSELDAIKQQGNLKSASIDPASTNLNEVASLSQNIPNPFNKSTRIDMSLPSTVKKAMLCIYTLQGEQLDQIQINERGQTNTTIEAYRFKPGMYLYALLADGNLVDTKKMVLTE